MCGTMNIKFPDDGCDGHPKHVEWFWSK